jgi:hypothetical protein
VAERGLVVADRGDRAAIALQTARRQQRGIAIAPIAGQEGLDRAIAQVAQVVTFQ